MNRKIKIITNCLLAAAVMLLLVTCAPRPQSMATNGTTLGARNSPTQTVAPNGIAQAARTYRSNGERIYFSSTSDRGTNITATGVFSSRGMMGNGGMMGNSFLTCASCHGSDGRGGEYILMGMQTIEAPDIRWSALKDEFNDEKFRLAITEGEDPDGKKMLNRDMPRWQIGNEDLADLIGFLKTL